MPNDPFPLAQNAGSLPTITDVPPENVAQATLGSTPPAQSPLSITQPTQPSAPTPTPAPQPQQPRTRRSMAAEAAHNILGSLYGYREQYNVDPNTGKMVATQVKSRPGDIFRNILAGAILGGAAASEAHAQNPEMGGVAGAAVGAKAGLTDQRQQALMKQKEAQEDYERAQKLKEEQRKEKEFSLQEQNLQLRQQTYKFNLEHANREELLAIAQFNNKSQEEIEGHNQWADQQESDEQKRGGWLAPIPGNGTPNNARAMFDYQMKHSKDTLPPGTAGRKLISHVDTTGLKYNPLGHGWEDEKGNPVDLDDRTTVSLYYTPLQAADTPETMTGANLDKFYGVKGLDPNANYTVNADKLAGLKAVKMQNSREADRERHEEAMEIFNLTKMKIAGYSDQLKEIKDSADDTDEEKASKASQRQAINSEINKANTVLENALSNMPAFYTKALRDQIAAEKKAAEAPPEKPNLTQDQIKYIQSNFDWSKLAPGNALMVDKNGTLRGIPKADVAKHPELIEVPSPAASTGGGFLSKAGEALKEAAPGLLKAAGALTSLPPR